jgi:hypothetical protein
VIGFGEDRATKASALGGPPPAPIFRPPFGAAMRGESETPEVGRGASPASRFFCYTSRSSISAPASMIAV